MALPANPPPLTNPVASNQCAAYTDGEGLNAICAPLYELTSALMYQGNDINTQLDGILKIVSAAIPSDNVLGELTQLVTLGLISNTGYAAGASITGVAATIQNAIPGCKCDLAACYSALSAASQATSINSASSQAACAEADYACAPYYSTSQVDKAVPGCCAYHGTTNQ